MPYDISREPVPCSRSLCGIQSRETGSDIGGIESITRARRVHGNNRLGHGNMSSVVDERTARPILHNDFADFKVCHSFE